MQLIRLSRQLECFLLALGKARIDRLLLQPAGAFLDAVQLATETAAK